jgi:azurin
MVLAPVTSFAQGADTKTKAPAKAPAAAAKGGAGRTVEITATDPSAPAPNNKYGFMPSTIEAKPGERLHIVLKAVGTMPKMASSHDLVIFKPGTKQADIDAFMSAAMMAASTGYIPADKKTMVLANTAMAGAGETVEASFAAPTAPGDYIFVCTFPGHMQGGMKGTLTVK